MPLKPLSEKDRLYFEMLRIYERLGMVLRDYEVATAGNAPKAKPNLDIIDPTTGKPWKDRPNKRKAPAAGTRRKRGNKD